MSNVREYCDLRTLAGALAAHQRALRVAASAAAFIALGLTAAQCDAAGAASSEPQGVSNAAITADGRK
jgi:hypothetical protein